MHFHLIPKPDKQQGLGVEWPEMKPDVKPDMGELKRMVEEIKSKM